MGELGTVWLPQFILANRTELLILPKTPGSFSVYIHSQPKVTIYGCLSKLWSFFGVLQIIRHLVFRGPKRGPHFG